jgi:hypothetical protein
MGYMICCVHTIALNEIATAIVLFNSQFLLYTGQLKKLTSFGMQISQKFHCGN